MIGKITHYDEQTQTGTLLYENRTLTFHLDQWDGSTPPKVGDQVDFIEEDGVATELSPAAFIKDMRPVKYKLLAAFLGIVLGAIGMHRFYLGYYGVGIAQILVTFLTAGYGLMWGFIEGVLIFTGHINKDAKGRLLI